MITEYVVQFHVLYNAQHVVQERVKAHTKKKAIKIAEERLCKRLGTDCLQFEYCYSSDDKESEGLL